MRFRLTALFYATAVIGASIPAFTPAGILLSAMVVLFWGFVFSARSWKNAFTTGAQACAVGMCLVCCIGLLLPAVGRVGPTARANQCGNQLRQIGLAINNYHYKHGTFPPAYLADENGRPMHSWRVLILPWMEEKGLYESYDFTEPWDGPNNSRLVDHAPFCYQCRGVRGGLSRQETSYVAIVGPNTMWPGSEPRDMQEIQDGKENTLLVVEAPHSGIHWMEPRDLTVDAILELHATHAQSSSRYHDTVDTLLAYNRGWSAVFADNHTARFDALISRDLLEALATVNGGEYVDLDAAAGEPRRQRRWGRAVSLGIFLVLVLLPVIRLPRHVRDCRAEAEELARPLAATNQGATDGHR